MLSDVFELTNHQLLKRKKISISLNFDRSLL